MSKKYVRWITSLVLCALVLNLCLPTSSLASGDLTGENASTGPMSTNTYGAHRRLEWAITYAERNRYRVIMQEVAVQNLRHVDEAIKILEKDLTGKDKAISNNKKMLELLRKDLAQDLKLSVVVGSLGRFMTEFDNLAALRLQHAIDNWGYAPADLGLDAIDLIILRYKSGLPKPRSEPAEERLPTNLLNVPGPGVREIIDTFPGIAAEIQFMSEANDKPGTEPVDLFGDIPGMEVDMAPVDDLFDRLFSAARGFMPLRWRLRLLDGSPPLTVVSEDFIFGEASINTSVHLHLNTGTQTLRNTGSAVIMGGDAVLPDLPELLRMLRQRR